MFVGKAFPLKAIFGIHIEVFPNYSDNGYTLSIQVQLESSKRTKLCSRVHQSTEWPGSSIRERTGSEGGGSGDPRDMRGAGAGVAGSQQTGVVTEARADTWNYECGLVTADPAQDKHKQHAT